MSLIRGLIRTDDQEGSDKRKHAEPLRSRHERLRVRVYELVGVTRGHITEITTSITEHHSRTLGIAVEVPLTQQPVLLRGRRHLQHGYRKSAIPIQGSDGALDAGTTKRWTKNGGVSAATTRTSEVGYQISTSSSTCPVA